MRPTAYGPFKNDFESKHCLLFCSEFCSEFPFYSQPLTALESETVGEPQVGSSEAELALSFAQLQQRAESSGWEVDSLENTVQWKKTRIHRPGF